MSIKDSSKNLSQFILDSNWAPYILPPVIFIVCWNLQTALTLMVGMAIHGGYFIVSLIHGARITSFFLFGFRAVVGMTAGSLSYFYVFPDQTDGQGFYLFAIQNIIYSLVVYSSIEIIRRVRKLDDEFGGCKQTDLFWMIGISSLVCTVIKPMLVGYTGDLSLFALLTFQTTGRIVGSLVVLYTTMYCLSILQHVKLDSKSS